MLPRRDFVLAGAALSAIPHLHTSAAPAPKRPASVIRIGVMGLSRGQSLALDLAKQPEVEISHLCDVDSRRASSSAQQFRDRTGHSPQIVNDFRTILDDPTVDALVCAAPNHWHAPATIMACKAGKHVYVEKPCSHNPREGEWMVAAADKFKRCVQMGTQRRSAPGTRLAMERLHSGAIGNIRLSRCYYNNLRGSIGSGAEAEPPQELDFDLWQGPAPRVPYRTNVVHYNWHWFWHWGGGELANNGVHGLDLCRWGLQVDYPTRVVSSGGRYWFDDDQETPDVQSVCFEFANEQQITWDALSCNKHRTNYFCAFFGDAGSLELEENGNFRLYDRDDRLVEEAGEPSGGQVEHLQNFIEAIRANDPSLLNQPIIEAHRSTLLCHLGNIAQRSGETVHCEPTSGFPQDHAEQQALWRRDYDPAWQEAVSMD
jgi:predicted dehydrogenase